MELGIRMQNTRTDRRDERRSGSDRRLQAVGLDFPFVDGHGNLVTEERRKSDRRSAKTLNDKKNFA